jgi:lactate dehydrogenase-like 2-hydroxyacid dehydrogenase
MLEKLKEKFEIITFKDSPLYLTKEIFISRAKDADIVVMFDFLQIDEEIFEKCKNLKTIVS